MPTSLPARRPLSIERQALATQIAEIGRLVEAARHDRQVRLRTLLLARLGLWLLRRQLRSFARRYPDQH